MNVEFIGQSVELVETCGGPDTVESAARCCTQTEADGDSEGFVRRLSPHHTSPREFGWAYLRLEVDRAIQQELTRHRHFSFNIESTRWTNYRRKPLRFVTKPPEGWDVPPEAVALLEGLCVTCANYYETLLDMGAPRDYARKALPLATASRVSMAGNFLCWLQMIPKRLGGTAHPEAREVARKALSLLRKAVPVLFDELPTWE